MGGGHIRRALPGIQARHCSTTWPWHAGCCREFGVSGVTRCVNNSSLRRRALWAAEAVVERCSPTRWGGKACLPPRADRSAAPMRQGKAYRRSAWIVQEDHVATPKMPPQHPEGKSVAGGDLQDPDLRNPLTGLLDAHIQLGDHRVPGTARGTIPKIGRKTWPGGARGGDFDANLQNRKRDGRLVQAQA